jgi:hypothetical protein
VRSVEGGLVDEFLYVTVERLALDQLEVEVGSVLEERVRSGLTADHREDRQLEAVDQVAGKFLILVTQGSAALSASGLEPSIRSNRTNSW